MTSEIRLLSLWQPWATLVALGLKQYETRHWATAYRGRIAIHATKTQPVCVGDELSRIWDESKHDSRFINALPKDSLGFRLPFPQGAIVAVVDLTQCPQMTNLPAVNPPWGQISLNSACYGRSGLSALELAVGLWEEGRFAWRLENVKPIAHPIPCKGQQGLPRIRDAELLEAIERELAYTAEVQAILAGQHPP